MEIHYRENKIEHNLDFYFSRDILISYVQLEYTY